MARYKNYKDNKNSERPLRIEFDLDGSDSPDTGSQTAPALKPHHRGAGGKGLVFMSFGSGSSGNSAYLGTPRGGILIDAGIDPDTVFKALARNGIGPDMVKGVILTHDHQDHVRYAYRSVTRSQRRIYCTPRVMKGMLRRHCISRRIQDFHDAIFKEIPFRVMDMEITAFETSHDGSDNMGFSIEWEGRRFVVATDMGVITDRAAHYMRQANYLMIESNYDRDMLVNGTYPQMLKDRVMRHDGHLDNKEAARFVAENYHDALNYVFLCHLSDNNNTPEVATDGMRHALEAKGLSVGDGSYDADQRDRDIQVYALPRFVPSSWFILD